MASAYPFAGTAAAAQPGPSQFQAPAPCAAAAAPVALAESPTPLQRPAAAASAGPLRNSPAAPVLQHLHALNTQQAAPRTTPDNSADAHLLLADSWSGAAPPQPPPPHGLQARFAAPLGSCELRTCPLSPDSSSAASAQQLASPPRRPPHRAPSAAVSCGGTRSGAAGGVMAHVSFMEAVPEAEVDDGEAAGLPAAPGSHYEGGAQRAWARGGAGGGSGGAGRGGLRRAATVGQELCAAREPLGRQAQV
jgi:hypothetical protein